MENIDVNGLDAAVLVIVCLSALLAFVRGAAREILAVAAWIGAVVATWYGFEHLRPYAREHIEWRAVADIAAAAALFVGTLLVLSVVTHTLSPAIKESAFGALDRSLGFVFGAARGVLLAVLLLMAWSAIRSGAPHPDWMRESRSLPYLERGADWIERVYHEAVDEKEAAAIESLGDSAGEAVRAGEAARRILSPSSKGGARSE